MALDAPLALDSPSVSGESAGVSSSGPSGGDGVCDASCLEERHFVWRKNAAFFYDAVLSHKLEWPSLTVRPFSFGAGNAGPAESLLSPSRQDALFVDVSSASADAFGLPLRFGCVAGGLSSSQRRCLLRLARASSAGNGDGPLRAQSASPDRGPHAGAFTRSRPSRLRDIRR